MRRSELVPVTLLALVITFMSSFVPLAAAANCTIAMSGSCNSNTSLVNVTQTMVYNSLYADISSSLGSTYRWDNDFKFAKSADNLQMNISFLAVDSNYSTSNRDSLLSSLINVLQYYCPASVGGFQYSTSYDVTCPSPSPTPGNTSTSSPSMTPSPSTSPTTRPSASPSPYSNFSMPSASPSPYSNFSMPSASPSPALSPAPSTAPSASPSPAPWGDLLCTQTVEASVTALDGANLLADVQYQGPAVFLNQSLSSIAGLQFFSVRVVAVQVDTSVASVSFAIDVVANQSSLVSRRVSDLAVGALAALTGSVSLDLEASSLTIKSRRTCEVAMVERCSQVSAKIESGAAFVSLNQSQLADKMMQAFGGTSFFGPTLVTVESLAAVPVEQPDTVLVGLRVEGSVEATRVADADVTIGLVVMEALKEITAVESQASFLDFGFTITPCHGFK